MAGRTHLDEAGTAEMKYSLQGLAKYMLFATGLVCGSGAIATAIEKQCLWNKGGYVLRVQ